MAYRPYWVQINADTRPLVQFMPNKPYKNMGYAKGAG